MAKKSPRSRVIDPIAAFKLLADANRFRALTVLAHARKGMLVGELAESLDMEHSAASHLLALLSEADVVVYRKEGRTVCYSIAKTSTAKLVLKLLRAA